MNSTIDLNMPEVFVKENVSMTEYKIHLYAYNLGLNVPRIYSYNSETKILKIQRINNMCVSDFYGEKEKDVPHYIFDELRKMIKILYEHDIEYLDITGYNVIEYNNKVWLIDFGHAKSNLHIKDKYLLRFINGKNQWNKEFK